ncbi:MAG: hypothetical protein ABIN36_03555 [Ferruginibacter sp.]
MKKIAIASLLICFLINGCKKGNEINDNTKPVPANNADIQQPTASFKIANLTSLGMILEANISDFQNLSQNGNTYHWDFGNGITSDSKIPQGISFTPCGATNTISLSVTNKSGQIATCSQTYTILCRGKHARHAPITVPVHLSKNQIPAFMQNL